MLHDGSIDSSCDALETAHLRCMDCGDRLSAGSGHSVGVQENVASVPNFRDVHSAVSVAERNRLFITRISGTLCVRLLALRNRKLPGGAGRDLRGLYQASVCLSCIT